MVHDRNVIKLRTMSITPFDEELGRDAQRRKSNNSMKIRPKWYLSGHTMGWILLNVLSFGLVPFLTFGASLIPIVLAYIRRDRTKYTLAGGRFHIVKLHGFLGKEKTKQIPVRDITDISTSATFMERQFDVGTVTFRESDGAYSEVKVSGIPRHKALAEEIGKQQNMEAKSTRYQA